jgi:hypothetical protein
MSTACRPARRAALAIRSRIAAIFSEIDIKQIDIRCIDCKNTKTTKDTKFHEGFRIFLRVPSRPSWFNYIIAVGGAGSLGSPALVSGKKTINAARPAITIIPPIK